MLFIHVENVLFLWKLIFASFLFQGLNELYDFKEKNPDADLAPYLKKSSEFFQSYIENGMKTIAQERRRGIKKGNFKAIFKHLRLTNFQNLPTDF